MIIDEGRKKDFNLTADENGFTLLGALMGMAIFVIGILAVFALQTTATGSAGNSLKRTEMNSLGLDTLERLISAPYDDPKFEPPYSSGAVVDPLEQINCSDNSEPNGFVHEIVEGAYTIRWAVFTSDQNGKEINDYSAIKDDTMFDDVKKNQKFADIPNGTKMIKVHVSHPLGKTSQFVFIKSNT